jgi:hypothetical protein
MSVLITAATNSAAFQLARILNTEDICFASDIDIPVFPGKRFLKFPSTDCSSFIHEVLKICLDNQIVEIYPLLHDEIIEFSKSRQLFEEFDIKLVIPSMKWIETRLNDLPCLSANLFVLIDGNVCAGNIAKESILLLNEENGIFQWEFKNNQLIFSSFRIGYA